MSIPQTFIHELLNRADIVDVIGKHITLKKGGVNFLGLCPFHGEKTPSFSVSPSKQFYHCFGCGKSGNAIGFLMDYLGTSFVESVQDLAGQLGLAVPQEQASPEDRARAAQLKAQQITLTDVLARAAQAYAKMLNQSSKAKNYFAKRGVSDEIAQKFELGYAPEGWRTLASIFPDYDDALLVDSGLVITHTDEASGETKKYDRFRDRVMFPIRNSKGQCIGFGGRVLDNSLPKYLNSPETPVFSKGRELYGLFEGRTAIRDKGYCLVTEGYMDVVALAQWGFANSVATLGTACTSDHVHQLFRATDQVIFSFDGDAAGIRAAHKALLAAAPYATDTRTIKFLFLPDEHDPDSFIRTHGSEVFEKYVFGAQPLSNFLIEVASETCDLASAEGRAKMCSQAMPLWMALPDGALKRQIIQEIAQVVQINQRELLDLWRVQHSPTSRAPKTTYGAPPRSRGKAGFSPRTRVAPISRLDQALRLLLSAPAAWHGLSLQEQHLLCHLPSPHGAVFTWLEHQVLEYGTQNWAALSNALQNEPFAAFVHEQMKAGILMGSEFCEQELHAIMDAERVEILKKKEQEILELFVKSPENKDLRERYEALKTERLALQKRD